jgi:hypothetical protein
VNLRGIIERNINGEAVQERIEVEPLNGSLQAELRKRGLEFCEVDKAAFRAKLVSAEFHADWTKRYGDEAWLLLQ